MSVLSFYSRNNVSKDACVALFYLKVTFNSFTVSLSDISDTKKALKSHSSISACNVFTHYLWSVKFIGSEHIQSKSSFSELISHSTIDSTITRQP